MTTDLNARGDGTVSEFGHFGVIGSGFCIDGWGAGPFLIVVGGTTYRFEDSDRFGPILVNNDGSEKAHQPGERGRFWPAFYAWRSQGRRLVGDVCEWDPPKATKFRRVGRMKLVVENGDDDGPFEEVSP